MPQLGVVVSTAISRMTRSGQMDRGATMVEYALVVTAIAMVVIAALLLFGPAVASLYGRVPPGL